MQIYFLRCACGFSGNKARLHNTTRLIKPTAHLNTFYLLHQKLNTTPIVVLTPETDSLYVVNFLPELTTKFS